MYACETCGVEFETLSQLRLDHDPCPVEEERRRREEAIRRLEADRGLEIGDRCRVIETAEEVEIVDVEPAEGGEELKVVWVPAGEPDEPEHRRTSPATAVV